ncbi:MAG: hypothetical protein HZA25_00855 [Candidatus Niyogibacteria bacterium]|nr:hypothetical protein [Candidatus Niyogibacteria bacterium]
MEAFYDGMFLDRVIIAIILLGVVDAVVFLAVSAYFAMEVIFGSKEPS